MTAPRKPQAFVLPDVDFEPTTKSRRHQLEITIEDEPEHADLVVVPQTMTAVPRRIKWLGVLLSCLASLFTLWCGLQVIQMVESFFAVSPWLGWLATAIAMVAALAALAIIIREALALLRLNKIETLQEQAARAINLDERTSADVALSTMSTIYAGRVEVRDGLQQLSSLKRDIIDPRDKMRLAERLLLAPLDEKAHKIIARRARRVTLLTTVTPAAALDILFVAAQNLSMIRELATLYGGRPSTLTTLKLARMVATHLAITGGLALSDNLIQHFVGKGLLGKLSARFGEGAVNGILTSRIGLATCAVCRPIPRDSATAETLSGLLKEVLNISNQEHPHAKN